MDFGRAVCRDAPFPGAALAAACAGKTHRSLTFGRRCRAGGRFPADGINSLAGARQERMGVTVSGQPWRFLLFDPGTGQWYRKGLSFPGKSTQIKPVLA